MLALHVSRAWLTDRVRRLALHASLRVPPSMGPAFQQYGIRLYGLNHGAEVRWASRSAIEAEGGVVKRAAQNEPPAQMSSGHLFDLTKTKSSIFYRSGYTIMFEFCCMMNVSIYWESVI